MHGIVCFQPKRLAVAALCLGIWLASPLSAQELVPFALGGPAPSLDNGGEWLNTDRPLDLRDLRGKFVLLDFWTYCCINCMHILPELKKLERDNPNHLVVIGVHSAKFFNERDAQNVQEAIERYDIEHPVVNDPQLILWQKYAVDMWPSLRLIDPEGRLVGHLDGEFTADVVKRFLKQNIPAYRRKQVLDETPWAFNTTRKNPANLPLRFPGKVLADTTGQRLFIADSGHHRIVVAKLTGEVLDVIGSGAMGREDGSYSEASFDHPQGMALREETLFVADTENHLLRKVDLSSKRVTTIAGTGEQARVQIVRSSAKPLGIKLASPWDLCLDDDDLYIAMAGTHQIWRLTLKSGTIGPFAGNATEDIVDGPRLPRVAFQKEHASFAQPSGLALDGQTLYVADSEGSSIRAVPLLPRKDVVTVLGTSRLSANRLFTFGDQDGPISQALLQHPLGLAFRAGRLYIADTYNSKIKELDLKRGMIRTLAGPAQARQSQPGLEAASGPAATSNDPLGLDEPGGLSIAGDQLYVADTNNHAIRVIEIDREGFEVRNLELKGLRPPQNATKTAATSPAGGKRLTWEPVTIKPIDNAIKANIELSLPLGYKLNPADSVRYYVRAAGDEELLTPSALGKWTKITEQSTAFEISIPLKVDTGEGRVAVSIAFTYCRSGAEGICKVGEVTWVGKVTVSETATADRLTLKYKVPQ
jgi:thiol-disulfide isomerase/thioredoxin